MSQEPGGRTVFRRSQTIQDLQHQGQSSSKLFTLNEKPTFDANTVEQRLLFALEGVCVCSGQVFQGVIWNFTDILTRVFAALNSGIYLWTVGYQTCYCAVRSADVCQTRWAACWVCLDSQSLRPVLIKGKTHRWVAACLSMLECVSMWQFVRRDDLTASMNGCKFTTSLSAASHDMNMK